MVHRRRQLSNHRVKNHISMQHIGRATNEHAPVDENTAQTLTNEIRHERAVVAPHRLDTFTIHAVVLVGLGEVEAGVAFLVDEQVRKVDLRRDDVI